MSGLNHDLNFYADQLEKLSNDLHQIQNDRPELLTLMNNTLNNMTLLSIELRKEPKQTKYSSRVDMGSEK